MSENLSFLDFLKRLTGAFLTLLIVELWSTSCVGALGAAGEMWRVESSGSIGGDRCHSPIKLPVLYMFEMRCVGSGSFESHATVAEVKRDIAQKYALRLDRFILCDISRGGVNRFNVNFYRYG